MWFSGMEARGVVFPVQVQLRNLHEGGKTHAHADHLTGEATMPLSGLCRMLTASPD
jgi:hypothetical protein